MIEDKGHIFLKYTVVAMILMIYTLGCWVGYVTMMTMFCTTLSTHRLEINRSTSPSR